MSTKASWTTQGFRPPEDVRFSGFEEVSALARGAGLTVVKKYSFPFPRFAGKVFAYNEFVVVTRKP